MLGFIRTNALSARRNVLYRKTLIQSLAVNKKHGQDVDERSIKARLTLGDGSVFEGFSFGATKSVNGEVVFTTGMVGYTESLTDPSYRGQILTLTYPMVGNYGVPSPSKLDKYGLPEGFESDHIHATALLVQDYSYSFSHWDSSMSLSDWLKKEGVPAIHGIDTRLLTKKIRSHGAILGKIEFEDQSELPLEDPHKRNLVAEVSTKEVKVYGKGNPIKIMAIDCGIKSNMIRMLLDRKAEVTLVPWNYEIFENINKYDGLFISNGPGDPNMCVKTIEELRKVLNSDIVKPIFGICLGNQLLALAAGGKTEELPFGNRGQNQPVINMLNKECYITPQNHGYAVYDRTLPKGWKTLFKNANDGTNEGIYHISKPIFSAQFHPEAMGGPTDTAFLFDVFLDAIKNNRSTVHFPKRNIQAHIPKYRKVLMLGSGGLSIGQAGEFDYSGSQAIKALKEGGIKVVLINPNIASVQTNSGSDSSNGNADSVYFLPVNAETVEEIIKKERPDGILISMGGQTALNCGVELHHKGIFKKYGVKVMGTPVETVIATEDREIFNSKLKEIGEKIAQSKTAENVEEAKRVAKEIGYPVMIRSAYSLGGLGSGICQNEQILEEKSKIALALSPQILVEKSLLGWKELEYEVVRDAYDNCITVCNMENFDPLGIHTGESIVVAPSQTLSNREYHMLRETAIKVVRHLGVVGECNIQYALDPHSLDYCIIEVNARLSRSSALASKATGYPLAFVAAKIAMGTALPDIKNSVTGTTQAMFEPSLDYVVTKIPRWDLGKFKGVSKQIGTAMKSVGEVMAIGRTWEESIQKALRMVDPSVKGFEGNKNKRLTKEEIIQELLKPTDKRIFAIAQALQEKILTLQEISNYSNIDPWFLRRLERIVDFQDEIFAKSSISLDELTKEQVLEAKQLGYSDLQIANLLNAANAQNGATSKVVYKEDDVRQFRIGKYEITPWVKQIDTLAAEYPAQTNYLYTTYHGAEDDIPGQNQSIVVLGSGTYRIGSSVEFDWCGVSTIRTLRRLGYRAAMINYNPETVSTDYDECDELYFEELSKERILDIYEKEHAKGIVVSMGGQIPNNLALPLSHQSHVKIIGTDPKQIDRAENREIFSSIIDQLGLQQAEWKELKDLSSALSFADKVGYPVLVRPSYVLSGAAMKVAYDSATLTEYLKDATSVSPDHPVVISKFIQGGKEIEMDGVAKNGNVEGVAIHEHVEEAGVHSGDATLVLPPQNISEYMKLRIEKAGQQIVKELQITGPFNIQFIIKDSNLYVIECNLRASRSFPFISKVYGTDFIEAATKLMLDLPIDDSNLPTIGTRNRPNGYVAVKSPMFSFTRLGGADPVLGVEMASTGEVACFGNNVYEAFLKSLQASNFKLPKKKILLTMNSSFHEENIDLIYLLAKLGYDIYCTGGTYQFLNEKLVPCHYVDSSITTTTAAEATDKTLKKLITDKEVDLVINLQSYDHVHQSNGNDGTAKQNENVDYFVRRSAVDFGIPLITNEQLFQLFVKSLNDYKQGRSNIHTPLSIADHYAKENPELYRQEKA